MWSATGLQHLPEWLIGGWFAAFSVLSIAGGMNLVFDSDFRARVRQHPVKIALLYFGWGLGWPIIAAVGVVFATLFAAYVLLAHIICGFIGCDPPDGNLML